MMLWLETKYINLLSSRLPKFKRKSANLWNFRCPLCNDSQTNKNTARGYIYLKKGTMRFHCHNCGVSASFPNLIKSIDPSLYYEFIKEKLVENKQDNPTIEFENKMKPPVFAKKTPLKDLKKISSLAFDHPAKTYVEDRLIPAPDHYKLFYASKFKEWVNSMIPDKLGEKAPEEPRLVIPFLNKEGDMVGFQGRSFSKKAGTLRYITIMLDENQPRLYGMDAIDPNYNIYVFEGPIDSMFIPNSLASAGGDIIRELSLTSFAKERIVVVYDNEARNPDTVKKIIKSAKAGYRVCIWPDDMIQKDINEMILAGSTSDQIKKIIDEHTYNGLGAELAAMMWRKC